VGQPLDALGGLDVPAWLVGGAVRDRLLGRATTDYDVVVAVSHAAALEPVARDLARTAGGFAFALSETFGAWRVVAHARDWQVDLMVVAGGSIEADLRRRDLTVNALAQPLWGEPAVLDPTGGVADLQQRRLRTVSAQAFADDPLRVMRLVRLAVELEASVEPDTAALATHAAGGLRTVAPERVFAELRRVIASDRALAGLELMDAVGATAVVLPELVALEGIEQSRFHHLDVLAHTRAVLAETISLEGDPGAVFSEVGDQLSAFLARPLANELTRGQALRFGALLHDIAKPQTRAQSAEGRITFMRHDETGAGVVTEILGRLRVSERLSQHVAALTRHHLRLGFLVHHMPLERREVYRYLEACSPVAVDVTALSVADRLATRGDNAEGAIARHLELAREILPEALAWSQDPPRAPVRGDELSQALGIRPGPQLGELLHELTEAAYAGEVSSPEEAIGYARQLVGGGGR
jgi:putative nucleotidyltransferase with HDIG domain